MCSIHGLAPDDAVRALAAAVRALPASGRGASATAETSALLELRAAVETALLERVAVMDADGAVEADVCLNARGWLARALKCGPETAGALVALARRLHTDPERGLPVTAAALEAGHLTVEQAKAIHQATAAVPVEVVAQLEATLVARGDHLSAPGIRRTAEDMVRRLLEQQADGPDLREREQGSCYLKVVETMFGRYAVEGILTAETGTVLVEALDRLAAPASTTGPHGKPLRDHRTHGERRHDALADLVAIAAASEAAPGQGGSAPHLQVLIDADTLLAAAARADAADDIHHSGAGSRSGCHGVTGHTPDGLPVPPDQLDLVACDARLSWLAVTAGASTADLPAIPGLDPAMLRKALATISPALGGLPLDLLAAGATTRLVTPAQRRALVVRDRGCVVPGCHAPARRCVVHHVVHWIHGGKTAIENLVLICTAHHRFLHERGWTLRRDPDLKAWILEPPPDIGISA